MMILRPSFVMVFKYSLREYKSQVLTWNISFLLDLVLTQKIFYHLILHSSFDTKILIYFSMTNLAINSFYGSKRTQKNPVSWSFWAKNLKSAASLEVSSLDSPEIIDWRMIPILEISSSDNFISAPKDSIVGDSKIKNFNQINPTLKLALVYFIYESSGKVVTR